MTLATALAILSAINTLISIAKGAPDVVNEAKSLLEKVRPHAQELGVDVATEFTEAENNLKAVA